MRASEKLGRAFVFLRDPQGLLASSYAGTYNEGRLKGILKPATVVVGRDRKVIFAQADEDYKVRPAARTVLEAVRSAFAGPVKR